MRILHNMISYLLFIALSLATLIVDGKLYINKRGSEIDLVEEITLQGPRVQGSTGDLCKCRCKKLHSNKEWECCKCAWTDEVCFPGDAKVQLESGQTIPMSELRIGEKVLTVGDDGVPLFTNVVTFLKRYRNVDAVYSVLKTSRGGIRMTPRHIVFTSTANITSQRQPRFAQDVSIGDFLFHTKGGDVEPVLVEEITSQIMGGVYVPLTETGTLVVDGMLVSSYSSINHHVAHVFLTPVRWFPSLFTVKDADNGMPFYVSALKWLAHGLLPSAYQGNYNSVSSPIVLSTAEMVLIGKSSEL